MTYAGLSIGLLRHFPQLIPQFYQLVGNTGDDSPALSHIPLYATPLGAYCLVQIRSQAACDPVAGGILHWLDVLVKHHSASRLMVSARRLAS